MPVIGPAIQQAQLEDQMQKIAGQQTQYQSALEPMAFGELSPIQQLQQQRHMQQLNQALAGIGQRFGASAGARGQANSPASRAYNQRLQTEMAQRSLAGLANQQAGQQMSAMSMLMGSNQQLLNTTLQQWNVANMQGNMDGQTLGTLAEIIMMGQTDQELANELQKLLEEYNLNLSEIPVAHLP